VLRDLSMALPGLFLALPCLSLVLPGAPRLVIGAPSDSEGWQEYPPRVWYSPEFDASKFTLHILSDTSGVFQQLKYIVLMNKAKANNNGQCYEKELFFTSSGLMWQINNGDHLTMSSSKWRQARIRSRQSASAWGIVRLLIVEEACNREMTWNALL